MSLENIIWQRPGQLGLFEPHELVIEEDGQNFHRTYKTQFKVEQSTAEKYLTEFSQAKEEGAKIILRGYTYGGFNEEIQVIDVSIDVSIVESGVEQKSGCTTVETVKVVVPLNEEQLKRVYIKAKHMPIFGY